MFLTFQFNVHTFIHYTTQLKQPKEQSKHLHFMFNYFLIKYIYHQFFGCKILKEFMIKKSIAKYFELFF